MSPLYAYVGSRPDTLDNGRPIAPGERVTLDAASMDVPHNKRLIDEGLLVEVVEKAAEPEPSSTPAPKASRSAAKE